jgi:hypothetical protein
MNVFTIFFRLNDNISFLLLKWIIYIVFLVHREEIELRILDYLSDEGLITVFENNAENNIELIEDFVKNLSLISVSIK